VTPLEKWNPRLAVIFRMKKDRRKKERSKTRQQDRYEHTFPEAYRSAKDNGEMDMSRTWLRYAVFKMY